MVTVFLKNENNPHFFPGYGKICSVEMLNYKLNAQGGFTPAAVAPQMR